jgi:hypothetical protein
MVELIYKKMNQWRLGRRKMMQIDRNKELTVALPDSVDSRSGGNDGVCGDRGEAVDDGKHPTGSGCRRWQWDLEIGGKSPAAAEELGHRRGMS